LNKKFVGKNVKITHTGPLTHRVFSGVCKKFIDKGRGNYELVLTNGEGYGFYPDKVTDNSVEGDIMGGRRIVSLE
jgi:hypothetical protein